MYFGNLPISLGTARIIEFQWDGTLPGVPRPTGHCASWGCATEEKNMNHKILIAALAGLSLFAAAQSQTDKQKPKPSTTSTQVSGNKTSMDDWTQRAAKPASSGSDTKPTHVSAGDVNGDGRNDAAVSNNSAPAAGSSKVPAPRDVASGQASGKRQHQPITITKEVDKASTRVATGDVNGDGTPDVVVSKNSAHATEAAVSTATASSKDQAPRDAASGQPTGKRQHQPITVKKEVDKADPLLKQ